MVAGAYQCEICQSRSFAALRNPQSSTGQLGAIEGHHLGLARTTSLSRPRTMMMMKMMTKRRRRMTTIRASNLMIPWPMLRVAIAGLSL